MPLRLAARILLALAVLLASGAAIADAPKEGTVAERAALAPEDATHVVSAADLAPPDGLSRFTGKPIVRVDTVTVGGMWSSKERVTTVRAGEPFSGEAARRAVREVMVTGRYARAGVEAYPEGDGVVLRLALLPRRVIATLSLSGGTLDRAETLEAGGLTEGGEVTAPALDIAETRIAALYANRGFPKAIVSVDATDTDDPDRAVVSIDIEPGAPLLITRRTFLIDPVMTAEIGALRERYQIDPALNPLEEILRKIGFPITPGERADEPTLADADRELAEVLRESGFLRAEVRHQLVRRGSQAEIQVKIASGPRLVPLFDGNRSFDADQLAAALDLRKGGAARSGELGERLRDFYVKRGFLDAEIAVTERGGPGDAIHYLAFRIVENRRVRVTRRLFPCLTGELSADDVGGEIQTFLDEELPRADGFSSGDPRALFSVLGPTLGAGSRPAPLDIDAATTFAPQPYERARKHLKDLFYSKGYLNAVVGPVSLMRARCDPRKAAGGCVPEVLPPVPPRCERDALGLPLPEPPLPATHRCEHDPAHGVECAPEVTVVLPIHLGPRSLLHDIAFEGNRQIPEQRLAGVVDLELGRPVSSLDVEAARLRLLDYYQSRGYAYADVHATIEPSPDRTRARAKFSIAEHEIVLVRGFVVKGAKRTDEALIRSRVALALGLPYRQNLARLSEERIAALGTFTSVSVGLEDPEVPQRDKRVVVTVVEQLTQYLEPRIGFSTGEGFRFAFEYGNRNVAGGAQALTLRVQLSYLPDLFVPQSVKDAYRATEIDNVAYRLERRNAASLLLPDIGLGPLVGLNVDLIDVKDVQRDYGIGKEALVPTVTFRPNRQLTFQGSLTAEYNDVLVFKQCESDEDPSTTDICVNGVAPRFLLVPEGQTVAFSQRVGATWDARNNPFAATSGVLLAGGVEHVNAFAVGTPPAGQTTQSDSHFIKLTGKVSGYVPLGPPGFTLAMSLSGGWNIQLEDNSATYPDRLFFLGGVDSNRAFLADSVVPQDLADCIKTKETSPTGCEESITINDVPIRGGDLVINSRLELRFPLPLTSFLQGGVFLDAGNLWRDWQKFEVNERLLRWGLGFGVRIATPIGPIAFDYGFNLTKKDWEDFGAFQFSIGVF